MEKSKKSIIDELRKDYDRWNFLYVNGGSEPFWSDGSNLNLVRNHILNDKRRCKELLEESELPEEFFLPTPNEVDQNYMANPEEIREKAKKSLEEYEINEDFKYSVMNESKLTEKQKNTLCYMNIIGYKKGLEMAIQRDDLVTMRRHRNPSGYIEAFSKLRKSIQKLIGESEELPLGQLSIFDIYSLK